uniref:Catalase protein n=1 Tax=Melanopsichium pennsylvanicum 4 TaxID=1398559 RepID=A0A077R074_9BASI|nr:catalase protein [Melanopsichium pennsylvanicum 4]
MNAYPRPRRIGLKRFNAREDPSCERTKRIQRRKIIEFNSCALLELNNAKNAKTYMIALRLLHGLNEDLSKGDDCKVQKKAMQEMSHPTSSLWRSVSMLDNFWKHHNKLNVRNGLVEHKPLRSINRVTKDVYRPSSTFRRRMNDRDEIMVDDISHILYK